MNSDVFTTPERTIKPRSTGITMVIDSYLGLNGAQDLVEVGGPFIDYVKLGWATALINPIIEDKIRIFRDSGIDICLGGTFFELAYLQNKLDKFNNFLDKFNIKLIEISDGTVAIPRADKLKLISQYAKRFRVLSEYGSKDSSSELIAPHYWAKHMQEELDAGAWKVVAEGRESGTAGLYRGSSELRTGLVDEIVDFIDIDKILWEAPKKPHQAYFIKKFGSNVNLGNIAPKDIIPLETLRLGLRSDTLLNFHQTK